MWGTCDHILIFVEAYMHNGYSKGSWKEVSELFPIRVDVLSKVRQWIRRTEKGHAGPGAEDSTTSNNKTGNFSGQTFKSVGTRERRLPFVAVRRTLTDGYKPPSTRRPAK